MNDFFRGRIPNYRILASISNVFVSGLPIVSGFAGLEEAWLCKEAGLEKEAERRRRESLEAEKREKEKLDALERELKNKQRRSRRLRGQGHREEATGSSSRR